MWPLHSPVKFSQVWVKTSICFPEQHLHSAWIQAGLTALHLTCTAAGIGGRDKCNYPHWKPAKTVRTVLSLLQNKNQRAFLVIHSCKGLRFLPHSALCLHLQLQRLSLPLWASKTASPSSSHHETSVDGTWPVCTHPAGLTHGKSAVIPGNTFPEGQEHWHMTVAWIARAAAVICCCSWSSEPWDSVGPACWMWLQAAIPPERKSHFMGRKWSEKGSGMERKNWIIKSSAS